MRKLTWGAVLAAAAAGAWWLYKEFGPPCDDLARERGQGARQQDGEPSLFRSLTERRAG